MSVSELEVSNPDPPVSKRSETPGTERWRPREVFILMVCLTAVMAAFHVHLRSVLVSDMDEGTYLYAGQLVAKGLVPYSDFLLAHPPLIAFFTAGCAELFGSAILPARFVYMLVILGSTVPLYAIVRSVARSQRAALISVVAYTCGMLLVANMGRTVRLEPFANAFVIAAMACRFLRPKSLPWMAAMGAFFACALFVKATAILPPALLFVADTMWQRPWSRWLKQYAAAAAGAAAVLLPGLAWCLARPHFVRDVLLGQMLRPRLGVGLRMEYLAQNLTRYPVILIGLVAAAVFLLKSRDVKVRTLAFIVLGGTIILVFAFKTFFNYYIVQLLPWIGAVFAIAADTAGTRWLGSRWPAAWAVLVGALAVALPVGYAEFYERKGVSHVAGPRRILERLRGDDGYVYSMFPAFALWSGRPVYPWYYQADSLVPRINGWLDDQQFIDVFSHSTALILYAGELDTYPKARQFVEQNFQPDYQDHDWALWLRPQRASVDR
jgi:hypothetical protein